MRFWRHLSAVAALAVSPFGARAQNTDRSPAHSLIGKPVNVGGFFAMNAGIGNINGSRGVFSGADIGVLLNHQFSFALSGAGLVTGDDDDAPGTTSDRLRFGYGGVSLGYVFDPASTLHYAVDMTVGGGSVRPKDVDPATGKKRSDRVFIFEPSVVAEVNLSHHLRAAAGASYRAVSGVGLPALSNANLSGFALRLGLRAGRF